MKERLSKVGVARRYVTELREYNTKPKVADYKRARELAQWIQGGLKLPSRTLEQVDIVS